MTFLIYTNITYYLLFTTYCSLFTGCQKTPLEVYEPELNVFCVLKTCASEQEVKVSRSYKMDEKSEYDLENVLVVLSGDDFADTLIASEDSCGIIFISEDFNIQSLLTYNLFVSAEGMGEINGHTTVPGDFEIVYPEDGDSLESVDEICLKKSQDAAGYNIAVEYEDTLWLWQIVPQDTTSDSLYTVYLPFVFMNWSEGPAVITISAVDSNYYSYREKLWKQEICQEGIEGGLGLFGSAVTKAVTVSKR